MHRTSLIAAAASVLLPTLTFAQPTPTSAPAQADLPTARREVPQAPPPYTPVRWNEDYSYLKNSANRSDFFDPIKYIPLNPEGDWYLSLGGHARYRYEYFNNLNFGAGPEDNDGYHLTRAFAHADLHLGRHVRFFVQGKTVMEDGRTGGPRPNADADEADIQQLFVDLSTPLSTDQSLNLRLGRQDLIYGAQRLISPLDWANARRTFEGGKFTWASPRNTFDAFWVRPVLVDVEEPNDGDGDTSFAGVYDTLALPDLLAPKDASKLELYALALNKTATSSGSVPIDSDTYTLGSRFSTNPKPWDLDVEADYQFGNAGPGEISAWSFAVEGGHTFACPLTPRLYLGFDIASGDHDPSDPDRQTFNQLFPLGHAYLGYIDVVARQNIIDIHPGLELTFLENKPLAKRLWLRTDYHVFWRQSDDDALYAANGSVLRPDTGTDASFIGSELDLLLTWQVDRHTQFYLGYSHFFAGSYINDTGPSQDIDFLYMAASFTF